MNSYIRSLRSVTFTPSAISSRTLKPAIDFLAMVMTGFWPAIACISSNALIHDLSVVDRVADAHVQDDLLDLRRPA